MSDVLDQWEAVLKLQAENHLAAEEQRRIGVALIELVRKKEARCEKLEDTLMRIKDHARSVHTNCAYKDNQIIGLVNQAVAEEEAECGPSPSP